MEISKDTILFVTGIVGIAGAILFWINKVWWTSEFADAKKAQVDLANTQLKQIEVSKDEVIKAKDAMIAMLTKQLDIARESSPDVLLGNLQKRIESAYNEISRLNVEVSRQEGLIKEQENLLKGLNEMYNSTEEQNKINQAQIKEIGANVGEIREILLLGETGTGKELFKRYIHEYKEENDKKADNEEVE